MNRAFNSQNFLSKTLDYKYVMTIYITPVIVLLKSIVYSFDLILNWALQKMSQKINWSIQN